MPTATARGWLSSLGGVTIISMTKKLHQDLAAAYGMSTTAVNKALKAAHLAEAARFPDEVTPPVTTPPVTTPPVTTPPVTTPPVTTPPVTTTPVTGGGSGLHQKPSLFTTPLPANTQWGEVVPARTGTQPTPGHWGLNKDEAVLVVSKPTDPLWTWDMPDYIFPTLNRNQRAQKFTGVHAPAQMTASTADGDQILMVRDGNILYETWGTQIDNNKRIITLWENGAWRVSDLTQTDGLGHGDQIGGVRACNQSWALGLILKSERQSGVIPHALAVALQTTLAKGHKYVAPATCGEDQDAAGTIPMGAWMGIPRDVDLTKLNLTNEGLMFGVALQTYGAEVTDWVGGSQYPVYYCEDGAWTNDDGNLVAFWGNTGDKTKWNDFDKLAEYIHYVAGYRRVA